MTRYLISAAATLVLVLGSTEARAGRMYLEWLGCDPAYKLWEVNWQGPWNVLGGKHFDRAKSNAGPWKRLLSYVPDGGCYSPAQNLRWYRIAKPTFPLGYKTLAAIWVPQTRCSGVQVN